MASKYDPALEARVRDAIVAASFWINGDQGTLDEDEAQAYAVAAFDAQAAWARETPDADMGPCEVLDGIGVCRHIALCPEGARLHEDWSRRYRAEQASRSEEGPSGPTRVQEGQDPVDPSASL